MSENKSGSGFPFTAIASGLAMIASAATFISTSRLNEQLAEESKAQALLAEQQAEALAATQQSARTSALHVEASASADVTEQNRAILNLTMRYENRSARAKTDIVGFVLEVWTAQLATESEGFALLSESPSSETLVWARAACGLEIAPSSGSVVKPLLEANAIDTEACSGLNHAPIGELPPGNSQSYAESAIASNPNADLVEFRIHTIYNVANPNSKSGKTRTAYSATNTRILGLLSDDEARVSDGDSSGP